MRFSSCFGWEHAWQIMEINPKKINGPATNLETTCSSQSQKCGATLCTLTLLSQRKRNNSLRASLILKGMFTMFACAALTYLKVRMVPRVRKINLNGPGYNSKNFVTNCPLWTNESSSSQIILWQSVVLYEVQSVITYNGIVTVQVPIF